nr:MAG TPA: hypothetical protein [Caudoviricetes sp.]
MGAGRAVRISLTSISRRLRSPYLPPAPLRPASGGPA